jgi:hypothetical protein
VRKGGAALGSLLFLILAPGTTAVLIPWLLTRWEVRVPPPSSATRVFGLVLIIVGRPSSSARSPGSSSKVEGHRLPSRPRNGWSCEGSTVTSATPCISR